MKDQTIRRSLRGAIYTRVAWATKSCGATSCGHKQPVSPMTNPGLTTSNLSLVATDQRAVCQNLRGIAGSPRKALNGLRSGPPEVSRPVEKKRETKITIPARNAGPNGNVLKIEALTRVLETWH